MILSKWKQYSQRQFKSEPARSLIPEYCNISSLPKDREKLFEIYTQCKNYLIYMEESEGACHFQPMIRLYCYLDRLFYPNYEI